MAIAGNAVNYLTPTGSLGGEVSRAALLRSTHGGPAAVSSVVMDKLMIALAHLLVVLAGAVFLFWSASLPRALWGSLVVTTGLLTAGMAVFLLLQKHGKLGGFCRWLVDHKVGGRPVQLATQQISKVDEELKRFYRERPRGLGRSLMWHGIGHSADLLNAWLFLRLLDQPAPLAMVAAAGFLSLWFDLLTFAVPMNLGTLEGSRILVFRALGCQGLLGMGFGIAIRMAQVFWAGCGLGCYAWLARDRTNPKARQTLSTGTINRVANIQGPERRSIQTKVRESGTASQC